MRTCDGADEISAVGVPCWHVVDGSGAGPYCGQNGLTFLMQLFLAVVLGMQPRTKQNAREHTGVTVTSAQKAE